MNGKRSLICKVSMLTAAPLPIPVCEEGKSNEKVNIKHISYFLVLKAMKL